MTPQTQNQDNINDIESLRKSIRDIRNSYETNSSQDIQFINDIPKKLATAVHLVTRHLPENSPLRESMRQDSIRAVFLIRTYKKNKNDTITTLTTLLDMITIAIATQQISQINGLLIEREIHKIIRYIQTSTDDLSDSEGTIIPKDTHLKTAIQTLFESDISVDDSVFSDVPSHNPPPQKPESAHPQGTVQPNRSQVLHPRSAHQSPQLNTKAVPNPSNSALARRVEILTYIRNNGRVTMRDIAESVTGVSEKSIQRTLLDLMESGDIRRIGDRRWSHYEPAVQV